MYNFSDILSFVYYLHFFIYKKVITNAVNRFALACFHEIQQLALLSERNLMIARDVARVDVVRSDDEQTKRRRQKVPVRSERNANRKH